MSDVDDFLAHYGVLGMHWGTRKAESRATRRSNKDAHNAAIKTARHDILSEALRKESLGKHIVGSFLTGTWYSSSVIIRDSGYSTGKSVVAGFLGGPFATMIAIDIRAHERVAASKNA